MAIVEADGVDALSMRRLANQLGVQTPTLYWHVGSRQQIFDRLIERITDDFANIRPTGDTPAERIAEVCVALLAEVRRRPHVIAISRTAGRGEAVFTRVQEQMASEIKAAGLHGHEAAFALRAILFHLGGYILVEHSVGQDSSVHGVERWQVDDPELRADLRQPVDLDELFRYTLDAILARLLPADPRHL
jgi:TetR/AcrR family transcriptional regulator, tetracycline repressor protein